MGLGERCSVTMRSDVPGYFDRLTTESKESAQSTFRIAIHALLSLGIQLRTLAEERKHLVSISTSQKPLRIGVHTHLMAPSLEPEEQEMDDCLRFARRVEITKHVLLGNLYLGGKNWVQAEPD